MVREWVSVVVVVSVLFEVVVASVQKPNVNTDRPFVEMYSRTRDVQELLVAIIHSFDILEAGLENGSSFQLWMGSGQHNWTSTFLRASWTLYSPHTHTTLFDFCVLSKPKTTLLAW